MSSLGIPIAPTAQLSSRASPPPRAAAAPAAHRRLRLAVIAVVFVANASAIAAMSVFLADSWRAARADALNDGENLNFAIGSDLEAQFSRIDFALQNIVETYAAKSAASLEALQPLLDRETRLLTGVTGLRVVDPEGDIKVASGGVKLTTLNIAEWSSFQAPRDNPDIGLFISSPEIGRVSRQWLFTLGRRLVKPDGSFGGEVHATVRLADIQQLFSEFNLPTHSVIALWNEEPRLLASSPALATPEQILEARPSPELRAVLASHAPTARYESARSLDGVRRLYATRKLHGLPLYVTTGAAVQDLFSDWLRLALQFGAIYLLFALASIVGAGVYFARAATRLASEAQLRIAALVFDNSVEAMVVLAADGTIVSVNRAFVEITGRTAESVVGRDAGALPRPDDQPEIVDEVARQMQSTGCWTGNIWSYKASGERFLAHTSIRAIRDDPSGLQRSVLLFSDITEQTKAHEAVWRHANLDPLTSLPNRRRFRERLGEEIERARTQQQTLGLVFVDLDRFKDINDSLGHHSGDKLLQQAAQRIRNCVRKGDLVARLGGDEFTVILPNLEGLERLEESCRRIVEAIGAPFELGEETCYVSASVGLTVFPGDAPDADGLLRAADMAMYAAKRDGRNKYVFFEARMQTAMNERAELVRDLRQAIAAEEFELHYQPVVTMATGAVGRAEALIRWRHPTRGLVGPADFIALAEDAGLIVDIGDWVFREAIRQLSDWRRDFNAGLTLSVNVSPAQFTAGLQTLRSLPALLRERGLAGSDLILEITEGVLLGASAERRDVIVELNRHGVAFALDDFGTGYSSLAYLKQYEISFVKIDKSFVDGLAEGASDLAICEAVIAMGRRLNISIVAEGIETEAQRQLLAAARCEYGQGYLFSPPLPPAAFAAAYFEQAPGDTIAAA